MGEPKTSGRLYLTPSVEERKLFDAAAAKLSDKSTAAWCYRVLLREAHKPTLRVSPSDTPRGVARTRLEVRLGDAGKLACDRAAQAAGFPETSTWARCVLRTEAKRVTSASS